MRKINCKIYCKIYFDVKMTPNDMFGVILMSKRQQITAVCYRGCSFNIRLNISILSQLLITAGKALYILTPS